MKIILSVLAVILYSGCVGATELDAAKWNSSELDRPNSIAGLPKLAEALVNRLVPDADIDPAHVGEAMFIDIDGDGQLELLATLDNSGRAFFTSVITVRKSKGKYTYSEAFSNGISIQELSTRLVDLNHDGRKELLIKQYIDQYEGAMRAPVETVIFEWNGSKFVEASDKFPGYYRSVVIPKLQHDLKAAQSSGSTRVQADDYETFVVDAELKRAKQRGKVK